MKFLVSLLISITLLAGNFAEAAANKKETKPAETQTKKAPKEKPASADKSAKPNEQAKETTPIPSDEVAPEKVVVTVNGAPIREKQVLEECDKRVDTQAAQMAAMGWKTDESSRKMMREHFRDTILNLLTERALVAEQLKANKIEVTSNDVDNRFLETIKHAGRTLEQAEQDIKQQGMTLKDVKEQIYWQVAVEKLFSVKATDKDVSETDAKKFYDENPKYFDRPEQVQASHILVKIDENADEAAKNAAKAKAEELLKKVKAGEDFAELARANSDCPSKERGGDLGHFPRGQMVKPFEDAAFGMKKIGDISNIVETKFGYHIIKLTDHKDAKKDTFDEVKTRIIEELKRQKIGQFWREFSDTMRENARIEWSPEEKARRDQKEKEQRQNMEIPRQPEQ